MILHAALALAPLVLVTAAPATAPAQEPPAPPGRVAPTLEITVATANIRNFPDMSPAQVRDDVAAAARVAPDIVFWQEIAEHADHASIRAEFPGTTSSPSRSASSAGAQREVQVSWDRATFRKTSERTVFVSPGIAGIPFPSRYLRIITLEPRDRTAFPFTVEVQAVHYLQGAWNDLDVPYKATRQRLWETAFRTHLELATAAREAGRVVITGGDWNRELSEVSLPGFRPVLGSSADIDHVWVGLPDELTLGVPARTLRRDLHSDHDLLWGDLALGA